MGIHSCGVARSTSTQEAVSVEALFASLTTHELELDDWLQVTSLSAHKAGTVQAWFTSAHSRGLCSLLTWQSGL